ncbi:hypothetical protein [Spirosoma luteum]|uniref:hypothetical protein n=1 Tax=Spirosoma luteum TaxID=431553 RepID=UPI00035EFD7C|nr:hypothetical protein [Spirosoma luteum]
MNNQPISNQVGATLNESPYTTLDVATGQGAELVFWSLWQNRENLIREAAITLSHGDIDAYVLKEDQIGHLGDYIADLFMNVSIQADRLYLTKDPSIAIAREQSKKEIFRERKAELLARLKK